MTRVAWSQLRRWWRRLADVAELDSVAWWLPVVSSGDPSRAEPPTITWQPRGAVPMLRLGPESRLWQAGLPAPGIGELRLITLASIPLHARLVLDGVGWQVIGVQERGPYPGVRLLRCTPAEVPS